MADLIRKLAALTGPEAPEPKTGPPAPDTLQVLLGEPLEVNEKTGKAKGGIDPPAAAWALIWTLRAAGVRLGIAPEDPNYINLRPASLVSTAQRKKLELLSYDIWWLLGAAPLMPGDLQPPPVEPERSPSGARRLRRHTRAGRRQLPDWWVTAHALCSPGEPCVWAAPWLRRACERTCANHASAPVPGDELPVHDPDEHGEETTT